MKRKHLFTGVLVLAGLGGCATGEAGRALSPVEANQWVSRVEFPFGTPGGSAVFTLTQTVTITPTSTADQTANNTVTPSLEVPASIVPK